MQLIGMLDSPYVRRAAISLQLLGVPFEHRSVSVFRGFAEFELINPVVKAPTLVCDDQEVIMDSTLIIEYAEAVARPRTLMPTELIKIRRELRLIGLALVACEKSVQIVYERGLRPPEKMHEPWIARVTGQLLAAYGEIEQEFTRQQLFSSGLPISQAGVSIAVAWKFSQEMLPEIVSGSQFPALVKFSAFAEQLPEFVAAPHGESTYRSNV